MIAIGAAEPQAFRIARARLSRGGHKELFQNQKEKKVACWILNPFDNKMDLNTSDSHKLFKEGIKPLDETYDGAAEKAMYFQKQKAIDASESQYWATIRQITMDSQDFDVLKQPGKLAMSDLLEYMETVWPNGNIMTNKCYAPKANLS